ncbi:unnamed protein product [Vitrella brassicaformis CCMP3155]|uniref:Uncharacterized protein n=1 Tax=Vitrella brassicaformis (strain CCMP3155) TaxID=1169540 RepID=A0A0G4H2B6_VITBC|nr:unnamed protein product [Vitrella brassicaformis CCMP3155]|eukprot:CEM37793.1 unnamed protein product [Vitrella brassicaformis CCMP3155]
MRGGSVGMGAGRGRPMVRKEEEDGQRNTPLADRLPQGVGCDGHPPSAMPHPIAGALTPPREPIPKAKRPPAAANSASQQIRSTPHSPADPFIHSPTVRCLRRQMEAGATGAYTARERHQPPPPPRGAPSPTPLQRDASGGEGGQRHIGMALTHQEDRGALTTRDSIKIARPIIPRARSLVKNKSPIIQLLLQQQQQEEEEVNLMRSVPLRLLAQPSDLSVGLDAFVPARGNLEPYGAPKGDPISSTPNRPTVVIPPLLALPESLFVAHISPLLGTKPIIAALGPAHRQMHKISRSPQTHTTLHLSRGDLRKTITNRQMAAWWPSFSKVRRATLRCAPTTGVVELIENASQTLEVLQGGCWCRCRSECGCRPSACESPQDWLRRRQLMGPRRSRMAMTFPKLTRVKAAGGWVCVAGFRRWAFRALVEIDLSATDFDDNRWLPHWLPKAKESVTETAKERPRAKMTLEAYDLTQPLSDAVKPFIKRLSVRVEGFGPPQVHGRHLDGLQLEELNLRVFPRPTFTWILTYNLTAAGELNLSPLPIFTDRLIQYLEDVPPTCVPTGNLTFDWSDCKHPEGREVTFELVPQLDRLRQHPYGTRILAAVASAATCVELLSGLGYGETVPDVVLERMARIVFSNATMVKLWPDSHRDSEPLPDAFVSRLSARMFPRVTALHAARKEHVREEVVRRVTKFSSVRQAIAKCPLLDEIGLRDCPGDLTVDRLGGNTEVQSRLLKVGFYAVEERKKGSNCGYDKSVRLLSLFPRGLSLARRCSDPSPSAVLTPYTSLYTSIDDGLSVPEALLAHVGLRCPGFMARQLSERVQEKLMDTISAGLREQKGGSR